jgi:3-deoxy-D-manno-octulosonate 8-phosphate phosphatase (KDO 8-P phosphatase)
MTPAPPDLAVRCGPIELLVMDVDGVLTDGILTLDERGGEIKRFHVRDGAGIALWHQAGKHTAILSGRSSAAVDRRAAELGIAPVIQGVPHKADPFRRLLAELGLELGQACYIGDDLPDLPVLSIAGLGLAACPADAAAEVRQAAHLVTQAPGGRGAVREVIEIILRHQGTWDGLLRVLSAEY